MGTNSKIEWTDHTFNPWLGCTNISPGCDHCYAESWSKRSGLVRWGNHQRRRTSEGYWRGPLAWNARAREFESIRGHRQRVFCASLADVFDNQVDSRWRIDLFTLIKTCRELDWLLLTKRPQNIRKMLPDDWAEGYPNVWLGITAEDQEHFDLRWPHLDLVPAVIKFTSYEPAIGPLRLPSTGRYPNWLISGGESGGAARLTNPSWVRTVIDDCRQLGIAVFHKQWGNYRNNPLVAEQGLSTTLAASCDRHGKGGSLIDGVPLRQFPTRESMSLGELTNSKICATTGDNNARAGKPFREPSTTQL